jgi:hypothetical protein
MATHDLGLRPQATQYTPLRGYGTFFSPESQLRASFTTRNLMSGTKRAGQAQPLHAVPDRPFSALCHLPSVICRSFSVATDDGKRTTDNEHPLDPLPYNGLAAGMWLAAETEAWNERGSAWDAVERQARGNGGRPSVRMSRRFRATRRYMRPRSGPHRSRLTSPLYRPPRPGSTLHRVVCFKEHHRELRH